MNLAFLNPSWLWLLPAALFPVLLHLFFHKKPRKVIFSELRFIKLAAQNTAPIKKIQEWLLLLIRCLIICFLVLTISRPLGYFGSLPGKSETNQIIVLADVSYSMDYTDSGITRISRLKSILSETINRLFMNGRKTQNQAGASGKQVCIALLSDHIEKTTVPFFTTDSQYLLNFINDIKPSSRTSSLLSGLSFAYKLFAETNTNEAKRTIIVVTDLCGHTIYENTSLKNTLDLKSTLPEYNREIQLVFLSINSGKNENSYINSVKADGMNISAEIRNFSVRRKKCMISFSGVEGPGYSLNDFLDIPENSTLKYDFSAGTAEKNDSGKPRPCEIRLQEDNLRDDDRYYFITEPGKIFNLLIVDGDPRFGNSLESESYYLNNVISASRDTFRAKTLNAEEFNSEPLNGYDTIFLCNLNRISQEKKNELEQFMDSGEGKALVVTLGDKLTGEEDEKAGLAPANYPAFISESIGGDIRGQFRIAEADTSFFPDNRNFELEKISFSRIFKLDGGQKLVTLENGSPLLIEKDISGNKAYIFASSVDFDWTNFPSKPFYPYFLRAIAAHDKETGKNIRNEFNVGEPIVLNLSDPYFRDFAAAGRPSIITPEKDEKPFTSGKLSTELVFADTNSPGIYKLISGSRKLYFAVNSDRTKSEGDLGLLSAAELKSLFTGSKLSVIQAGASAVADLLNILEGKDLTELFLLAALLLAAIEIILSNYRA